MDVNKVKKYVMMYFNMSGYDLLSETAMVLVDKIKGMSERDQEKIIGEVHSHIMKSKMRSSNLEKKFMEAAVNVRTTWSSFKICLIIAISRSASKVVSAIQKQSSQ